MTTLDAAPKGFLAALAVATLAGLAIFLIWNASEVAAPTQEQLAEPAQQQAVERTVVQVYADADSWLGERVSEAVTAASRATGVRFKFAGPSEEGSDTEVLRLRSTRDAEADAFAVVRYWGAFADFWSERALLTLDASDDVVFYAPEEYREPVLRLLDGSAPAVQWVPMAEIPARLADDQRGVTLLPLDIVDSRLRSLTVDGVDPVRGIGQPGQSAMAERVWLSWQGNAAEKLGRVLADSIATPAPEVTHLLFTGDIMPSRCVYARQRDLDDYTAAFAEVSDVLRQAELAVGSLDSALSDAGEPFDCQQTFNLLAPARSVEGLAYAGFDVITVATNHAKDCGSAGVGCNDRSFLDTLANLREAGIQPAGGGENRTAAHQPVILERNGVRFAFLGYDDIGSGYLAATEEAPGTAALEAGTLGAEVASARQLADVVIVLNHWGVEYTPDPSDRQRSLADEALAAGATLVVGNHPHVVQAVEWKSGGFVAYSLGNFVFDQDWSIETQQGVVLDVSFIGDRVVDLRFIPVSIVGMFQPTWASPPEARQIIERMRDASR